MTREPQPSLHSSKSDWFLIVRDDLVSGSCYALKRLEYKNAYILRQEFVTPWLAIGGSILETINSLSQDSS